VTDLALKTLSTDAHGTTASVSESLMLGLVITDTVLQRLYRENLIELRGSIALHILAMEWEGYFGTPINQQSRRVFH
jgi:hypothetical protein